MEECTRAATDLLVEATLDEAAALDGLDGVMGSGPLSLVTKETIDRFIDALEERETAVIRQHFGLDGFLPLDLEEIAAQMGLLELEVLRLRDRALSKLRACRRPALLV